jgi:hypothetical protein|tara:strand:+ start:220 stop:444 length:225 start_codon:yes stop_codon:yes gene_type:complete
MKLFVIVLYLKLGTQLFMHPVQVTEQQCEDPYETKLLEHRVVKDGSAELDRFFYHGYMVVGSYCAGLLGSIENK